MFFHDLELPEGEYEEERILTTEKQHQYVEFFKENGFDTYQHARNVWVERGPVPVDQALHQRVTRVKAIQENVLEQYYKLEHQNHGEQYYASFIDHLQVTMDDFMAGFQVGYQRNKRVRQ